MASLFESPNHLYYSVVKFQWIPEGGITMFAYFLHAHLLGVEIQVEHFRDGKSIDMLAKDDSYDFNFQETRSFAQSKRVFPVSSYKITIYNCFTLW